MVLVKNIIRFTLIFLLYDLQIFLQIYEKNITLISKTKVYIILNFCEKLNNNQFFLYLILNFILEFKVYL